MTSQKLQDLYFDWLIKIVYDKYHNKYYRSLLTLLCKIEFTYVIDRDSNRALDGIDLREQFIYDENLSEKDSDILRNSGPCSVLEMMVALAYRCEATIMSDGEEDPAKWFWIMIDNMGIGDQDDGNFDERYCKDKINRMLTRKYAKNGLGGLFVVKNIPEDMRKQEIWTQLCWYLDSLY